MEFFETRWGYFWLWCQLGNHCMRTTIVFFVLCISFVSMAQGLEGQLDKKIDQVTYDWDMEADKLETYEGLRFLCEDRTYRDRIITLLKDIHHLDTVLYGVLIDLSRTSDDKEIKKTLKDIQKFEEEYDTKSFIQFMSSECKASKGIETNADDTRNEVGITSYSGQVYVLETELFNYVRHVTKRVDKIRVHVHHLKAYYE